MTRRGVLDSTTPGCSATYARGQRKTHNTKKTRCTSPVTAPLFPLESGRTSMWYADNWTNIRTTPSRSSGAAMWYLMTRKTSFCRMWRGVRHRVRERGMVHFILYSPLHKMPRARAQSAILLTRNGQSTRTRPVHRIRQEMV